jgi:hypothetical protein
VQITLSPEVQQVANRAAQERGFYSLTAYLKYMAINLAKTATIEIAGAPETKKSLTWSEMTSVQIQSVIEVPHEKLSQAEAKALLPLPQQFSTWPEHIYPSIYDQDPWLYALLIRQGRIR